MDHRFRVVPRVVPRVVLPQAAVLLVVHKVGPVVVLRMVSPLMAERRLPADPRYLQRSALLSIDWLLLSSPESADLQRSPCLVECSLAVTAMSSCRYQSLLWLEMECALFQAHHEE
jgi:hypothetical protein